MTLAFPISIDPDALLASLNPGDAIEQMQANCVMLSYRAGIDEYRRAEGMAVPTEAASALRKNGLALLRFTAQMLRRLEQRQGWEPPLVRQKREAAAQRAAGGVTPVAAEAAAVPAPAGSSWPEPALASVVAPDTETADLCDMPPAVAPPPASAEAADAAPASASPTQPSQHRSGDAARAKDRRAIPIPDIEWPEDMASLSVPELAALGQRVSERTAALLARVGATPSPIGSLFTPDMLATLVGGLGAPEHQGTVLSQED